MQSEEEQQGVLGFLSAGAMTTPILHHRDFTYVPQYVKIVREMLPTVFHDLRVLLQVIISISKSFCVMGAEVQALLYGSRFCSGITGFCHCVTSCTLKSRCAISELLDVSEHLMRLMNLMCGYKDIKDLLEMDYILQFRDRALRPDKPYAKTGAQNPDVYFQGRETSNKYYEVTPAIVQEYMDKVAEKFGRQYHLFDYIGAKDAEKIIIAMGSGCEAIEECVNYLTKKGEKVGAIKVRLYRPFSVEALKKAIPESVKKIAVLDRTKEPGSIGEPLYLDVKTALSDKNLVIIGGRYGLSSKEFTPTMVKAVYDHLDNECFHDFTVGITDDVTHRSVKIREEISAEQKGIVRCKFWGLGSDGT
jgi:pyruvate-ferredoxin/flavodoxin oxidoreductase